MTIRRQYDLPNCTLVIEGIGNESTSPDQVTDPSPLMSILVNAEFQFVGSGKSLSGGRAFFESLVKAVSAHTQEFLSGIHHPRPRSVGTEQVHLEKIHRNLHRLIWQSADSNQEKVEVDLSTVQLFDLVEAIDQFFVDNYTLPDLSLELQPVSRRHRQIEEPLVKRTAPAALGIVGITLSAIAFFFIPPPIVREPEPQPQTNPPQSVPLKEDAPKTE